MVTIATQEMMPELQELWRLGFGDDPSYAQYVFDHLLTTEKILVYRNKRSQIVGMLCMEPLNLKTKEWEQPAIYMYAFTVHPRFRKEGIGGEMLREMHRYLKAKGYVASILTPAEEGLFSYYGKHGYETAFFIKEAWVASGDLAPTGTNITLVPRSLEQLADQRDSFFGQSDLYVQWTPAYLQFVGGETKLRNGESLYVDCGGKPGYLVYRKQKTVVELIEFAIDPAYLEDVLFLLQKRTNATHFKLRLVADYEMTEASSVLPFAMIKWYDEDKKPKIYNHAPYLTYVMD